MFQQVYQQFHRAVEYIFVRRNIEITAINLCGGVACNKALRKDIKAIADIYELPMLTNPPSLCTDNAAMIAWMGWELKNSRLDVDLSGEDEEKIVPHTKIPLGSYAEGFMGIK